MPSKHPVSGGDSTEATTSGFQPPRGPRGPNSRPHFRHNAGPPGGAGGGKGGAKARNKRIRDIRRELSKDSLPATVRNNLEQEMESIQTQKGDKKAKTRRTDMISRYHMVRFFERQKATRRMKKLRKSLEQSEDPEQKASLERQIHKTEVDLAYTQYFPHLEPYVSIWPNGKDKKDGSSKDNEDLEQEKRPEMWYDIEKAMEEGTPALERIRERRDVIDFHSKPLPVFTGPPKKAKAATGGNKTPVRERPSKQVSQKGPKWRNPEQVQDEEDDGTGFFEM